MWFDDSVVYQIYPLGMCGAPLTNDGVVTPRIRKVLGFIPHLRRLGVTAVYFSPLFDAPTHGYDTRDFRTLDARLGTNDDLRCVCDALHAAGIRVLFDGVFNHVGREFPPFRDLREKRWESRYRDWFYPHFDGDTPYHDGFHYDCWEGHYELPRLNLRNPEVEQYLFDCIRFWRDTFGVDGLRLDVAYSLDREFLAHLKAFTRTLSPDFPLIGEVLFGDYGLIVREGLLDSCTNYENYKSTYSAINSRNLYELSYSLNRQFGREPWCIYRGRHLLTFLDNHDVSRIATTLTDGRNLPLAFALQMTTPGVPQIYYGSEWGIPGAKADGDPALRPATEAPRWEPLTDRIAAMIALRRAAPVLRHGDYHNLVEGNEFLLFERAFDGARAVVGVNLTDGEKVFSHGALGCRARVFDLTADRGDARKTGDSADGTDAGTHGRAMIDAAPVVSLGGTLTVPPHGVVLALVEP